MYIPFLFPFSQKHSTEDSGPIFLFEFSSAKAKIFPYLKPRHS